MNVINKYEVEILNVGDADAILIREYIDNVPYVILIDAGNVGDGNKVIIPHIKKYYQDTYDANNCKYLIDLAICTHPDSDNKGGFFDLLHSNEIKINEFWVTDPACYLSADDIKQYQNEANATKAVRNIYNNSDDGNENLLNLAESNGINGNNAVAGVYSDFLHLTVVGPSEDYYKEVVKDMVSKYGVETYDESDTEKYDRNVTIDEMEAQTVINEDDDPSPFNASSLIVYFNPSPVETFLFAGDVNCASLTEAIDKYPQIKGVTYFKVPHHGSKHNLDTKIISDLAPVYSIISAKGTKKHPSSAVVYWLSKEGAVYSTHLCSLLRIHSKGFDRADSFPAEVLKPKQ